jgi:MFS family permease
VSTSTSTVNRGPARTAGPWAIFTVVVLGAFMAQLDLFIVNIAFPSIQHDFSGTINASLSWVLNAYAIVFAACLVLADLLGRRRTFELGIVVFAIGSAGCAVSPDVGVLIAARIVQAIGAAMVIPTSLGIMLAAFKPEHRAGASGAWAGGAAVAATLGPPLGGVLILLSWRWIFIVNLPVAAIALASSRMIVPDDRGYRDADRPDMLGATLLVSGITALILATVEGESWGWHSVAFILVMAAGVVLLGAFLYRCDNHRSPIIELSLLKVRPFAVSNAAMLSFTVGFGAGLLLAVLFFTGVWHEKPVIAGLMIAPARGSQPCCHPTPSTW